MPRGPDERPLGRPNVLRGWLLSSRTVATLCITGLLVVCVQALAFVALVALDARRHTTQSGLDGAPLALLIVTVLAVASWFFRHNRRPEEWVAMVMLSSSARSPFE